MESRDLGFSTQNLNFFIASYPDIYEKFDHANWWFRSTDDPRDRNAELNIQFRTNDAELALNYANLIVEFVSRELIVAFEFEGTSAWKDWRGDQH